MRPALSDISNFKAHIIQFPVQRQQIFKSHLSGVYSRRCLRFSIDRILEEIIREEEVRREREKKTEGVLEQDRVVYTGVALSYLRGL